jgi:hypothetical protein
LLLLTLGGCTTKPDPKEVELQQKFQADLDFCKGMANQHYPLPKDLVMYQNKDIIELETYTDFHNGKRQRFKIYCMENMQNWKSYYHYEWGRRR